ncbi:hypothetical protein HO133_000768 [Letharia lupina]|uniref:Uncharacterized protein n=1 Tax=Letharia lupina TaxID=560253 RepID=A0A8H6CGE5_9LECA|nr:uncharacterized protein HO133_000768 [Letharia lupina]KAF6222721.1 hypothetical protein HO133_000768 [Letharia lupina]
MEYDQPPFDKTMPPLSAAELVKHPEFQHVTWALDPAKKGKIAVAEGRGGPIQISYQIHGNGPTKLVVGTTSSHHFSIKAERALRSSASKSVGTNVEIALSSGR